MVSTAYKAFSAAIEKAGDATQGAVVEVLQSAWDAVRAVILVKEIHHHIAMNYTRPLSKQLLQQHADTWDSASIAVAASTWRWQDLKQRAIDGCFSTAEMGCISLHEYSDWHGAHITIPHGFQVRDTYLGDAPCISLETYL